MTFMNDGKPRPATLKSKTTKSTKGQRTLFDMFSKKVDNTYPEIPVSFSTQPEAPGPNDTEGTDVMPGPVTETNSQNPSLCANQRVAEAPAFQARSNLKSALADVTFIQFDDSDVDILPLTHCSQTSSQGSRDAPIVIDSSPIKPPPNRSGGEDLAPRPKLPLHPFFAPRAKSQGTNARTTPRRHHTRDLDPPYPDRESQHVTGIQSTYPSIPCPFERRMTTPVSGGFEPLGGDCAPLLDFLIPSEQNEESREEAIPPATEPRDCVSSINQSHISEHPAIARVVDITVPSTPSLTQLWTEAWRPRHAKEVLGNEQSAIYLRNWLHTLALQFYPTLQENEPNKRKRKKTKKRPRIVREVPRKKPRRDGLGDWIVEDEEEEEEEEEEYVTASQNFDSSQYSEFGEETLPAYALDIPETISEPLHNTILLSGPPGSGKTAAVYACAEELGWEVFEVYPGIGRRNGANVDNLVGDVGKNHLVRKKQGATGQPSIATLLSSSAGPSAVDVEGDCLDTGPASSLENQRDLAGGQQPEDTEAPFRQSVILLEEVDLLFKDDANFWPAVTNFIKDCRRPVICTCNDASLVPRDELPLQKVLYFVPCAPDIATSYLQGLACAEGYIMPPERIRGLYSDTHRLAGADIPSDTSPATAHLELPDFDLRKAIHTLQMWCTTNSRGKDGGRSDWEVHGDIPGDSLEWPWDSLHGDKKPAIDAENTIAGGEVKAETERNIRPLDGLSCQSELLSYLDSCVLLPLSGRRETLASANLPASPDDENGHAILYGSSDRYEIAIHGFHDRDIDMATTAIRLARGRVARGMTRGQTLIDGDGVHLRWPLFRRRVDYQKHIGRIAWQSGGIGVGAQEVEVYTEYVPYIRQMVMQVAELGEPEGRMTRNSQRTKSWECVTLLGSEERKALTGAWLTDGRGVMG